MASHFLQILGADRRSARTKVAVGILLALALGAAAYALAPKPDWQGLAIHGGAVAAGLLLGWALGRSRVRRYEESIRGTWTQWMRYAVAAESVPEIHRKVRGKSGRNLPFLYAATLFLLWGSQIALLVLALAADQDTGIVLAAPVIAFNGLLAGGIVAYFLVIASWTATFAASVTDLVESGEINMWGLA